MKTYLYIKTHTITGMKYFGKTTKDPFKYKGSGKYWLSHIRKHGNITTTTIYGEFTDPDELTKAAIEFSITNNIAESHEWANLILENGFDGSPPGESHPMYGRKHSNHTSTLLSSSMKDRWQKTRESILESRKDAWSEDRKRKHSESTKASWTEDRRTNHSAKIKELHELGIITSKHRTGKHNTEEHCRNISKGLKGKPKTESHRASISASAKCRERICCEHCRKSVQKCHFVRYHGDKCKLNPQYRNQ